MLNFKLIECGLFKLPNIYIMKPNRLHLSYCLLAIHLLNLQKWFRWIISNSNPFISKSRIRTSCQFLGDLGQH